MNNQSPNPSRPRWQIGLRSVMLIVLIAAAVFAVVSLKLRQDARFERALSSLDRLGMRHSVGSEGLRLECREALLSDEAVLELIEQLKVVGQAHDLGFSPGLAIKLLDLNGANVSERSLARLREAFPPTRIEQ